MNVTIITCYDQNDYVRARTLRAALAANPDVRLAVIKNQHLGLLRYLEVPCKILAQRLHGRPDCYVITFRGYEMLPFVLFIKGRTPLVFDEFINPAEYLAEHNRLRLDSLAGRLFRRWYGFLLRRCCYVLADTAAHAALSAELCRLPAEKYRMVPVNADETVFYPRPVEKGEGFEVFYYGNGMTPLHGLEFVLQAAVRLKGEHAIHFTIVGGKTKAEAACQEAIRQGARITYKQWVPFEELPDLASQASLCLGGPFGKTLQSQYVITGKTYQFLATARPVLIGANQASGAFKDKVDCLVVPQADASAIVEAIRWAVQHPKELGGIAQRGNQLYREKFSQAVVNRQVAGILAEL